VILDGFCWRWIEGICRHVAREPGQLRNLLNARYSPRQCSACLREAKRAFRSAMERLRTKSQPSANTETEIAA
jgi:hypothetical protein